MIPSLGIKKIWDELSLTNAHLYIIILPHYLNFTLPIFDVSTVMNLHIFNYDCFVVAFDFSFKHHTKCSLETLSVKKPITLIKKNIIFFYTCLGDMRKFSIELFGHKHSRMTRFFVHKPFDCAINQWAIISYGTQ